VSPYLGKKKQKYRG